MTFGQLQLKSKVSPAAREMDGWLHSFMAWWIHSCLGHHTSTELLLCVKGLPRWLSSKESTCQWRRCRLDPWVGKSPWRKKWQTALVPLPEKSHGQKTGGLQSTGSQKLDTTEQLSSLSYVSNTILSTGNVMTCTAPASVITVLLEDTAA